MIGRAITLALVLALCAGTAAQPGETRVRDGDTIVVSGTPVRLKGLSCPERGTRLGDQATSFLRSWMARSTEITCTLTGEKTYDREVGWCELDGQDIGRTMIEIDLCQPCRRYDTSGLYADLPVRAAVPNYCNG